MSSRARLVLGSVVAGICASQVQAAAIRPVPNPDIASVTVAVGGTQVPIPTISSDGTVTFSETNIAIGNAIITGINGTLASDPFLAFSLSVTDNSAGGSSFAFLFSIPLSPTLVGPQDVHATLGVTATGIPGFSATVTPTFVDFMLNNVGACAAGVDIGAPAFTAPARASVTHNYDSGDVVYIPNGGCDDQLTAFVAFDGTGHGTQYAMTGELDITPIPEPAALELFGIGLLGLAALRGRVVLRT